MRKSYSFKRLGRKVQRLAAIMLVALMAVGSAFAEEVTFVFSEQGYENAQVITAGDINDVISFTCAKNAANNGPAYYNTSIPPALRFYAHKNSGDGNSMTLVPQSGYEITGLTIIATGANNAPTVGLVVDGGALQTFEAEGTLYSFTGLHATSSLTFSNAIVGTNTQLRVLSLIVTYSEAAAPAVEAPVFSIPTGNYYTEQTISLTCPTPGANIYCSVNGSDPVLYNGPFTLNATATVSAYATLGEEVSSTVSATYTFPVFVNNIAAYYAAENADLFKITGDVTFVYRTGRYVYVKDATGGLLIYDNYNPVITNEYHSGDVIPGGIVGTRSMYHGLDELVPTMNTAEALAGEPVTPMVVTVAEVLANPSNYISQLVMFVDGEFAAGSFNTNSATNVNFTQNGSTLVVRNAFKTVSRTFAEGDEASVIGFVTTYDNAVQLYPRNNADIITSVLPFTCSFENNSGIMWTFVNGENTNKWYIGAPQGFDNSKLYISSSNGLSNKYNVSAASVSHAYMDVTLPASDVLLTFDVRSMGEANDFLQVSLLDEAPEAGVLPDNSLTRIYNVGEFSTKTVLIPASYAGAKKLVFTWSNNNANGTQAPAAIDNVKMESTCTQVSNIAATVEGRTATITWDAPADQNAWEVQYKTANSDAWQTVVATSNTAILYHLTTNVNYDVRVRATCGESNSAWTTSYFNVPCIELTSGHVDVNIGNGTVTSYYAPFGPFYKNSWVQMVYPASYFETAGYINSLSWEVNAANAQECSSLKIYIGTTTHANNESTTDWVPMDNLTLVYESDNVTIGSTAGWETYTLSTPYYYNGTDNLVIVTSRSAGAYKSLYYKCTGNNTNAVMYRWNDSDASYASHPGTAAATGRNANLPNMKVDYTGMVCGDAICDAPTALTVSDVTTNSAVLNWEGNADSYVLSCKAADAADWMTINVTDNTYTLNDLDQNTAYMVRVKADCGSIGMSNEAVVNFTTVASCVAPQNLAIEAHAHTVNVSWLPVADINHYQVQVTGLNDDVDFVVDVQNASQTNITNLVEGHTYYIAVRAICGEESQSAWTVGVFTMPAICPAPTGLYAQEVTENMAAITWNAGDASAWTVECGPAGFTLGEGTQIVVNENAITLTGLNAYSSYDVYVKADCGLGYESNWSSKLNFTTQCGFITVTQDNPWIEDFERYSGSGNLAFDDCWATPELTSFNSPFIYRNYSTAAHSGRNSAELKGNSGAVATLVLPAFTNPLSDLQFSYYGMVTGTTPGTMQLGYILDPNDASSFVEVMQVPAQSGSFNRANAMLYGPFTFGNDVPAGARITLRFTSATSNCSWNLDDFTVELRDFCPVPSGIVASDITTNSAVISWNSSEEQNAWTLECGPAGFTPGTGTTVNVTSPTYTLTGLEEATEYDVYVRATCDSYESTLAGPYTFMTASNCTEQCDFMLVLSDSYGDGWNGGVVTVEQNGETLGTYTIDDGYDATYTISLCKGMAATVNYIPGSYPSENSFQVKNAEGTVILSHAGSYDNYSETFTANCSAPVECENTCSYTIELADSYGDGWNGGEFTVSQPGYLFQTYTIDDGYGETITVELCSGMEATFSYTAGNYPDENSLSVKNADGVEVWAHNGGDGSANFTLTPSCEAGPVVVCILPSNLEVTEYTSTSATLTWDGDTATQYEVSYYTGANDWVASTVTGTTITLTGLTGNSVYFVRVRALCDETNTYSNEVSFFTTNAGSACDDHTVSSQSGSNYYTPVNSYYKYSHSEQIYTPEEVGAAGNITKISFNYAHTATMTKKNNVTISLGHTTKSTLSTSDSWTTTGLTQVYQGNLNCSNGWNEFVLDTEFPYNGTDNLVVVVNDMSNAYDGSAYKFYYTNTSSNMCLTYQSDGSAWSSSSVKTARSYRPDIRFNVCSAATDIALLGFQDMTNACDLSNTTVAVNVKNVGSSNVTAFKLYYSVNGGAVVQENVALVEPLEPGDAMTCTFTQHANMTDASNIVKAWVEMVGDGNNNNNVVFSNPVEILEPATIPFTETFAAAEMHDGWSMVAPNNAPSFVIADNALQYNAGDEPAAEAIATSPCLDMSEGGNYIVTYDYKANSPYYDEQFSMFLSPSAGAQGGDILPVGAKVFHNTEYAHAVERVLISEWDEYDYEYDVNYLNIKAESGVGTDGFTIDNIRVLKAAPLAVLTPDYHGTAQVVTDNILVSSVAPTASMYLVPGNENVTIAISAQPGYHVQGIYSTIDDNMVLLRGENPNNAAEDFFSFNGGQYTSITVLFAPNYYNVNATVNNLYVTPYNNNALGATYTPNHDVVAHGGNHTGVLTVADHYHLEYVNVNGMDVTSNLVALSNNQYQLTLNNIWEDKDIQAVVGLDSTTITYTVEGGEGTINNEFVVDASTTLPAVYTATLPGYTDLLSTIIPAPGFHVASIVIDGVQHTNIDTFAFMHLFGTHTVVVTFAPNHYVITTTAYGNGTVTPGAEFDYDPEYTYTFTATPAAGYQIGTIMRNNVMLNVTDPAAAYTETLTNILDNYNYEVMFIPNTYTITATCGNNGMISPSGVSSYLYHQDAEYVITANPGYYIASVTYDGNTYDFTQDLAPTTFTVPFLSIEENHTISATFAQYIFTVTVNAGANGAIAPATSTFAYGATPTFAITPDAGYSIVDVTVDGTSVGAVSTYTFTALDADHTIAATFAANTYTIAATAGNGGTITPAGNTTVAYNANQTYTISASAGYHVSNVFVDGASVGAVTSYTFTGVTANHTIYAAFDANEYTVTVNQPAHGTITPGTMTVLYGATPAFVITPAPGYNVTAITVNGSNVSLTNIPNVNGIYTYTFAAINANQTITATMTAKTYTITASAGANGSITPNGNTTVNFGGSQAYTITPAAGYVVNSVTIDNVNMGAITSYVFTNVAANHTINATFAPAECEAPSFLYTTHIDSVSAILHWSHPSATTFDIQYKTLSGNLTTVNNVSGNSYQLNGLTSATTYMWQVRANCIGNNHSEWASMVSFNTDATTIDGTGIEDLVKHNIKVYAEHQNVHILNNEGMNIENVRIFDAYGKLIYSGAVSSSHEVINLNVAAGAYIVNVTTDEGVANYKVTILK